MKNYFKLLYVFLFITILHWSLSAKPIITRHDIPDSNFVKLAEKYPEINSLFFFNKTDMAGTLIKPDWVISAAHVATDLNVGDSIIAQGRKYKIINIVIHPEWQKNQAFDLALLKIKNELNRIKPVSVYTKTDELNKIVLVAGIGDKGTGISGPDGNDGKLRAATNRVQEVTDFWLKWDFDNPEKDSAKVTEMEGISGPGDSSGPAFIIDNGKLFLAGISSGQSTRATNGREGVYGVREYYARLSSYIDWINSVIDNE